MPGRLGARPAVDNEVRTMRRLPRARALLPPLLLAIVAAMALGWPAAAQDTDTDERVLLSVGGEFRLAAGETADVVVIINGDAHIAGTADVVATIGGRVDLDPGAVVDTVGAVNGTVMVGPGATVTDDIVEINSTVTVHPDATVDGEVRSMAVDLAGVGVALGVLGVIAWFAFALVTWAAGLALAAFGSRQVRSAEWLISTEPLRTFLAGILMVILPPIVAVLLMISVVLLPVGVVLLLVIWPTLAFVGWLVGATWIGEWILRSAGRPAPEHRPYLGVTLGLLAATVISLVPLVGAIISLFGLGAVALAGWRMLRGERAGVVIASPAMA